MINIVEVAKTATKEDFIKVINAHTIQILKVRILLLKNVFIDVHLFFLATTFRHISSYTNTGCT